MKGLDAPVVKKRHRPLIFLVGDMVLVSWATRL